MSSASDLRSQTIALAGVAQVARLVDQVACTGNFPDTFLNTSVGSLFQFEPDSIETVYGGLSGLKLGLDTLSAVLANRQAPEHRAVAQYIYALLFLERKFAADTDMMSVVRARLEHSSFKADHFSSHITDVCQSLAGIYQDTLSTLSFRIKVNGSVQHLQNDKTVDIVRALLLAGVRSAFLWHQLGGRRWRLLITRKQLLSQSRELSRGLGLV